MSLFGWGKPTPPKKDLPVKKETTTSPYDQFRDVTGASEAVAKVFVDHFEGDANKAASSFYDNPNPPWLLSATKKSTKAKSTAVEDKSSGTASSFSFMGTAAPEDLETTDAEDDKGNTSGFGFIGGTESPSVDAPTNSAEGSSMSGFNFMSGSSIGDEKMSRPKMTKTTPSRASNANKIKLVPDSMIYSGEKKPLNLNFKSRKKRPKKKKKKRALGWGTRASSSKASSDGSQTASSSKSMLAGLTIHTNEGRDDDAVDREGNGPDNIAPKKDAIPTAPRGIDVNDDIGDDGDDSDGMGLLSGLSIRRQSSDSLGEAAEDTTGNVDKNGDAVLLEALKRGDITEKEYEHLSSVRRRADAVERDAGSSELTPPSAIKRGLPPPVPTTSATRDDGDDTKKLAIERADNVSRDDATDLNDATKEDGGDDDDDNDVGGEQMDYEAMMAMMGDDGVDDDVDTPAPIPVSSKKTSKLQETVLSFRNVSAALNERLSSTDKQTEDLQRQQREILVRIESVDEELKDAEEKQNLASEREDFDAAERLNETIEKKKAERRRLESRESEIVETLRDLVQKKHAIFIERQKEIDSFLERVASVSEADAAALANKSKVADEEAAADDAKLAASEARLKITTEQYENHVKSHREDKEQIENSINERIGKFDETRKEATEKCRALEKELVDLRAVVAEKERALSEHKAVASRTSAQISAIRQQFEQTLRRLESREKELEAERRDCEEEQGKQAELRKLIERKRDTLKREISMHDRSVRSSEVSRRLIALLQDGLSALKCHDASWKETTMSKKQSVEKLETTMRAVEARASELTARQTLLETQISSAEAEIAEISRQLPTLEREKKLHAASRRFREAGKAAKQIKTLEATLEDAKLRVRETETSLRAATSIAADQKAEADKLRVEVETAKKSLDETLIDALESDVRSARRVMLAVKTLGMSEVDADGEKKNIDIDCDEVCHSLPHEVVQREVLDVMRAEETTALCELTIIGRRRGDLTVMEQWSVSDDDENYDHAVVDGKVDMTSASKSVTSDAPLGDDDDENDVSKNDEDDDVTTDTDDIDTLNASVVRKLALDVRAQQDELASLESKIKLAVEAEDFDSAEDLENTMNALKLDVERNDTRMRAWFEGLESRVADLTKEIDAATENEDYEAAATLDEEFKTKQACADVLREYFGDATATSSSEAEIVSKSTADGIDEEEVDAPSDDTRVLGAKNDDGERNEDDVVSVPAANLGRDGMDYDEASEVTGFGFMAANEGDDDRTGDDDLVDTQADARGRDGAASGSGSEGD
eukprot:g1781.t1